MRKRIFLFVMTFGFIFALSACSREEIEVSLDATLEYNLNMVEGTSQEVKLEFADREINLSDVILTWDCLSPSLAEISKDGVIKAKAPGEASFKLTIKLNEESKEYPFKVTIAAADFSVTYELNGGTNSELNPTGFTSTTSEITLHPATKTGYEFAGWLLNGEVVTSIPAGSNKNITLVASWNAVEYSITYDLDGGQHEVDYPESFTIESEEIVLKGATKAGYEFAGWLLNGEVVTSIPAGSNESIALVASWNVVEYSITYDLDGGQHKTGYPESFTIESGETVLKGATKDDYAFLGWYQGEDKVEVIPTGTIGNVTLVAKWDKIVLYVGAGTDDDYPTIAEALAVAKDGDRIVLAAGNYSENITVSVPNLTIVGPNRGVNPNTEQRVEEAVLTGTVTINASANNLTIDGLAFTTSAKVTGTQVLNLTFANNYCYDTDEVTTAWVEGSGYTQGFIYFAASTGNESENLSFFNNKFNNVSDANVCISYVHNVTFDGNVFNNFDRDAIRFNTGGYNYGVMAFTNNEFTQDSLSGYNGIYFRIYGGPGTDDTQILIDGNKFVNIGTSSAGIYSGAISARNYQEKGAEILIQNNVFEKCLNFIRIRNNGTAANHAASHWSCLVDHNIFIGVPTTNYFAIWNLTDSDPAQNPEIAEFGANYYEDNESAIITDLEAYANLIKNVTTKGTALSEKPILEKAEAVEFYSITYELNGGTVKGTISEYNRLGKTLVLPEPTKTNYVFLGWYIGSEKITEIDKNNRGNLHLVAIWEAIEGELYDITYEYNGGVSTELFLTNGTPAGEFDINNYDNKEGTFWGGGYANYVYLTRSAYDPKATFSDRIYIGKDELSGSYKIISILTSGASVWPEGAEYVITISSSYKSYNTLHAQVQNLLVGDTVIFTEPIKDISAANPVTVKFYHSTPENSKLSVKVSKTSKLIVPTRLGYLFLGWEDANGIKYDNLLNINTDLTLTAKWQALNPVTDIEVTNCPSEMVTGDEFQISAKVVPSDAYFQEVLYKSSDTDIFTVSKTGLLTAINAGTATLTITDFIGNITKTYKITVHSIDSIDATFGDESYTGVLSIGETVQIHPEAYGKNSANAVFSFEAVDPSIATVNSDGVITAVAAGETLIRVTDNTGSSFVLEVGIVVNNLGENDAVDRIIKLLVGNNFAVVETGNVSLYNDGKKDRVYDSMYGSVNKYLFFDFAVDETYYPDAVANKNGHKDRRETDTIEFVTVHDTATLTGTVQGIASNMAKGETSIHYAVGNNAIYGVVPEEYIAYHAGDGTGTIFEWYPTGVSGVAGVKPKIEITAVSGTWYFVVNGQTTNIKVPLTNGEKTITNPDNSYLSNLGPVWKVFDGQYYIGKTWACFSQVARGVICSFGGNNNSIGIEMCVNTSGDIYDTWQRTARLVADICIRNDLDLTRVQQHNAWNGKNCPQSIIAGNYWDNFMEMVAVNYEIVKNYPDAKITMKSNNPEIIDNTGRVVNAPATTTTVSYEISVTVGDVTKTITLYSVVPGSTTWQEWNGTYNTNVIWNNGVFAR